MEPVLGTTVCLICFKTIEKRIFVPSDGPAKIFANCITYLHSTLTKETLQDIQLNNENLLPLCKSCFDSALALTQLSEQLTTIQKDISDLTVAFSMAVFHRRSQVYSLKQMQNNSQSFSNSSIVEFNEACLPPNLFSNKNGYQNIHQNKSNHEKVINSLHSRTDIITNVNCESNYLQFPHLSEVHQPSIANDDAEIRFNNENLTGQCIQPSLEHSTNLSPGQERGIPHLECENDLRNCTDGDNEMDVTMSDLLKSVKMPEIKLERINIENNDIEASHVNSLDSTPEPRQERLDETLFMNEELSDPSDTPNTLGSEKLRKHFHFGRTIARENKRNRNRRTYITKNERPFKCSFCEKKFSSQSIVASHERIHTGERPFKCSFCENRFRTSTAVYSHEKTHTGERPYQCTICKKRFSHSSNLTRHEKTHTVEKHFKSPHREKKLANIADGSVHEKSTTNSTNDEHNNDDFIVGI